MESKVPQLCQDQANRRLKFTNTHNHLLQGIILEAVREFRGGLTHFHSIYIFLNVFFLYIPTARNMTLA